MEHLIFTGSANFPEDHYIEKVINKYQGEHNGVTKAFSTSFFYKLKKEGLAEFLPAFADAIINPTFTKENIEKEINNVNSEISMRMTYNKHMATYKLLKKIGNPNSKLFQDGFANIDSENVNIEDLQRKLHEFHRKYYSANIMTLVVIAETDLRALKSKVEENFSWVKNREVVRPLYNDTKPIVPPFTPDTFGKVYYIQGFSQPSKLTISFVTPHKRQSVGFHPLEFLSQFINYYSENSFKQILIKKNLITAFADSVILDDYVNAIYSISFSLTPYGLKHSSRVITHFFNFVEFVRKIPQKEQIFGSLSKASKFSFLFGIKTEFMDFSHTRQNYFDRAEQFSDQLLDYPPESLFVLDHVFSSYNETEFENVVTTITPQNAIFIIESEQFKLDAIVRKERESANGKDTSPLYTTPKTVRSRKLELSERKHRRRAESTQTLKDLFTIRPKRSMLELNKGRLLTEYIYNEVTQEIEEHKTPSKYFDRTDENVSLPYEFDFDGGRRYNFATVPAAELSEITVKSLQINQKYDVSKAFDTAFINRYKMITKCHTPPSLRSEQSTPRQSLQHLLEAINLSDESELPDEGLHTGPIFRAVFNDQQPALPTHDRLTIIRDLTAYKLCLVRDFNDDDKFESPELLKEGPGLSIYHRLFRKTLQPKVVLILTIESQMIIKGITAMNPQNRIYRALVMEVLCMYMVRHIEFEHRKEYVKGNDFSCRVESFRTVLTFEGLSDQIEAFVPLVLGSLRSLSYSQTFKNYVIENYKKRIIDMYGQFHMISSLKLSMFYLNLFLDRVFVDNSGPEKVELIRSAVQAISAEDLAGIVDQFLTDNKVFALGVGNVEQEWVIRVSERAREMLNANNSPALQTYDFNDFRKYMHKSFVSQIHKGEHLMVRVENIDKAESNSVYLTYFRIAKASRLVRLQALIMNHFLSKVVYGQLRNKLNLGYVAQAGLRVYYHVI